MKKAYSAIDDFIKILKTPSDNILAPVITPQLFLDCIIECFLVENWYVSYPCSQGQAMSEALYDILMRNNKYFRKRMKQQND